MNTKAPECWANDPKARALRVEAIAGQALLLPLEQFILAEFSTLEGEQQIRIVFPIHEVIVRGHSLRRIETALQRMELSYLTPVSDSHRPLMAPGEPVVREIVVTQLKDV